MRSRGGVAAERSKGGGDVLQKIIETAALELGGREQQKNQR